jgi:DNA-binding CsgD family transcriptional regulator
LRALFGDVDRISIDINTSCDLMCPQDYEPDMMISQNVAAEQRGAGLEVSRVQKPGAMAQHLLNKFRAQKVSLGIYHPPVWREYYHERSAYLGTIYLWRERSRPVISDRTLALLDLLKPFIIFLFTDLVTRHHYANPLERAFYEVVRSLADECHLGMRERNVLVLRLLGQSYKKIGDRLGIATNTVGKHVTNIYKKTGTGSTIDLFAKYFTPRLIGNDNPITPNR